MKKTFFLKPHVLFLSEGESGLPNAFPQNMKVVAGNSRILSRKMKVPGFTDYRTQPKLFRFSVHTRAVG